MKYLALLSLFFLSTLSYGDLQLIKDARITAIANTNGNVDKFTIWIEGGSGPCVNSTIVFPKPAAGSDDIYARAYSTALMAFAADYKIIAHDYDSDNCHNAAYIQVSK